MNKTLSILLLALFISACSDEHMDDEKHSSNAAPLFQDQRQMLDKAKAVDAMLQESVEKQRRMIEQQSQ